MSNTWKEIAKEQRNRRNAVSNGGNRENQLRIYHASQAQEIGDDAVLGLSGTKFIPVGTTNGAEVMGMVITRQTMPDSFTLRLKNTGDLDCMYKLFDPKNRASKKEYSGGLFTVNDSETSPTQRHCYDTVLDELLIGEGCQLTELCIEAETESDTPAQKAALARFLNQELEIIRITASGEKVSSTIDLRGFKSYKNEDNPNVRFVTWSDAEKAAFFVNDGIFFPQFPKGINVTIKATIQNGLSR
jgi:hypothetical protein